MKTSKKLLWIPLSIFIVIGAGAGVFAYLSATNAGPIPTPPSPSTPTPPTVVSAATVVGSVRSTIEAYIQTYPKSSIEDQLTNSVKSPNKQSAQGNYYINGQFGSGVVIADGADESIREAFYSGALAKVKAIFSQYALTQSSDTNLPFTYLSDSVICSADESIRPLSVTCADLSSYAALDAAIAPFATAYDQQNATTTSPGTATFSAPAITKKSGTYANARIGMSSIEGIGGWAQLFYTVNGSTWLSWKGTQSILPCSDYSSLDLQKAFEGDTCTNLATGGDGKVVVTE